MTKKELQQLRHLNNEIRIIREDLAELEDQVGLGAINQDGLPKGNKISRPTEQKAVNLADAYAILQAHEVELQNLKNRALAFIASLDDSLLRQIILLRFVDGKNWVQVATEIGGNVTPDNCRMIFARANLDD